MLDLTKADKLPQDKQYFNVSVLWIPWYKWLIRLLYYLRVPHELATIASITSGFFSAYLILNERLILSALFFHLKDLFDACDGSLARLTGRGHLIGRYLDSVGDFFAIGSVIVSISIVSARNGSDMYLLFGAFAFFSVFIQCSFFNYYMIGYVRSVSESRLLSKQNERNREVGYDRFKSIPARAFLRLLRFFYIVIYSWQDAIAARVDEWLQKRTGNPDGWFEDRLHMSLLSPLCFGTHIFVVILSAIANRIDYSLIFIAVPMNIYLLFVLIRKGTKRNMERDRVVAP